MQTLPDRVPVSGDLGVQNAPEQILDLRPENRGYRERARELNRQRESLENNLAEALRRRSRSVVRPDPARVGNHLICGVGPYELEILVQDLGGGGQLEFTGQVTRSGCVLEPVRDLPVELVTPALQQPVAATRTDVYGEFHLASGRDRRVSIRLGQGGGAPCVGVWDRTSRAAYRAGAEGR